MKRESLRNKRGQGIVEYALLLAFVVVLGAAMVGRDSIYNGIAKTMEAWAALFG